MSNRKLSAQRLGYSALGVAGTIGILILIRSIPELLPISAEQLVQDERALMFTDRRGLPLGTVLSRSQDQTMTVPLEQIAPEFLAAIVAAEDQRFYQHHGVDSQAVIRACLEALQARQIVSGASTITMQLARMVRSSRELTDGAEGRSYQTTSLKARPENRLEDTSKNNPQKRNLHNKLQEIWLAWRLEAGMSKAEILAAYVNRLPMGGNLYGVEAAARTFFSVPASDLTLAQATLLAALPNDPVALNPYGNLPELKQRQTYVLERMVQEHLITAEQAKRTQTITATLQLSKPHPLIASHFLFWLAARLPADSPAQIQTTIDRPLQTFVTTQVRQVVQSLVDHNVNHAAALVIENTTGEVLAYVGSPDYFTAQHGKNDGVQALRQPGSTLKPFLYQLALERGIVHSLSTLADVPTHYAIPGAQLYSPTDYNEKFQGQVRLRLALANSLNIPAVRLLEQVTVPTFLTHLQGLGFQHLTHSPDHYGLGLALGSGEVSLWELARAYVNLVRQGHGIDSIGIASSNGNAAFEDTTFKKAAFKKATEHPDTIAHINQRTQTHLFITDILSDPYARAQAFGVDSVLALPFAAAVKTGTSSDFRDTWTVGYTTDYTVATWVGNFDGALMQNVSGITGAAPLWHRIMLKLHEQQEPQPFAKPNWAKVPICDETGLLTNSRDYAIVLEYVSPMPIASSQNQPAREILTQATTLESLEEVCNTHNSEGSMQYAQGLKIIFPQADDRFILQPKPDTSQNPQENPQEIQFKVSAPGDTNITYRLNDTEFTIPPNQNFAWKLQPGKWTLEVQVGEDIDRINFEVIELQEKSLPRGFKFVDTDQD